MNNDKTYWTRVIRRDSGETVSQYTHATQKQVDEYRLAYAESTIWRLIVLDSDDHRVSDYKGEKNFGWLPFSEMRNRDGKVVKMSEIGYNWIG